MPQLPPGKRFQTKHRGSQSHFKSLATPVIASNDILERIKRHSWASPRDVLHKRVLHQKDCTLILFMILEPTGRLDKGALEIFKDINFTCLKQPTLRSCQWSFMAQCCSSSKRRTIFYATLYRDSFYKEQSIYYGEEAQKLMWNRLPWTITSLKIGQMQ